MGELRDQLTVIRDDFSAIQLPRSAHQRLVKSLNQVSDGLNDLASAQKKAEELSRWQGLLNRIEQLDSDDSQWTQACEKPLPQGYSDDAFNAYRDGQTSDSDSAQDICIQLESLADVETLASDKARRMELQVQRLAEGLGKGLSVDQERQQLVSRWLTVKASAELKARFINAPKASLTL